MTVCRTQATCTVAPKRSIYVLFLLIVTDLPLHCASYESHHFVGSDIFIQPDSIRLRAANEHKLRTVTAAVENTESRGSARLSNCSSSEYLRTSTDDPTRMILSKRMWDTRTDTHAGMQATHKYEKTGNFETTRPKRLPRSLRKAKSNKKKKKRRKGQGGPGNKLNRLVSVKSYSPSNFTNFPLPTRSPVSLLCPIWPNDSRIIVNCSNGRRVRSRCSVDCAPGFRFQNTAPATRRCRMNQRGRRGKTKSSPIPSWSGRDEQFVCVSACDSLPAPPNGAMRCSPVRDDDAAATLTSRTCEVTCDSGYTPSRTTIRHCQSDGTWSGVNATCEPNQPKHKRHLFTAHQTLQCGDVHGLTTFTHHRTTYIAASDKAGNMVRIYRWDQNRLTFVPWQSILFDRPTMVEVIEPNRNANLQLMAGNGKTTSMFRINDDGRFVFSHTNPNLVTTKRRKSRSQPAEGYNFAPLNGQIYRCKGQKNRRGRSIVVVQKLKLKADKQVFKRVMRRKMKTGESMYQCSMFVTNNKLHAVVTSNKSDGRGKIVIGVAHRGHMKVVDVLRDEQLRRVSGVVEFQTSSTQQYVVVGQSVPNGRCFVYKRIWNGSNAG